jgi:MoxR-like ATPase
VKPADDTRARDEVAAHVDDDKPRLARLRDQVKGVFRGKPDVVDLALTSLLAAGHVLLEDVPGVGKTTLARTIAGSLGVGFKRIQFTSDLLPADIVGVNVFDQDTRRFEFQPGPIFAHIVLADEINRTTPRTQSALLEAMNEGQVTVDNDTHTLERPFFVMATQNPKEFAGTYPLPESQMDRFLLRISIGYPEAGAEADIIRRYGHTDAAANVSPVLERAELLAMQQRVAGVRVTDELLDYLMAIVHATRESPAFDLGASTRGAIGLYRAVQARAYLLGRPFAVPDDVKALVVPALAHRVQPRGAREGSATARGEAEALLTDLLDSIPVPA